MSPEVLKDGEQKGNILHGADDHPMGDTVELADLLCGDLGANGGPFPEDGKERMLDENPGPLPI